MSRLFNYVLQFLWLTVMCTIPQVTFAELKLEILLPQKTFERTNEIRFEYRIESSEDLVVAYSTSSRCPTALNPLMKVETISLKAGTPFSREFQFGVDAGTVDAQECEALIAIHEPIKKTLSKPFRLLPRHLFRVKLLACRDNSCVEPATVFYLNEKVFLAIESNAPEERIAVQLVYPDGKEESVKLPLPFVPKDQGPYTLKASVSGDPTSRQQLFVTRFSVLANRVTVADKFVAGSEQDGSFSGYRLGIVVLGVFAILGATWRSLRRRGGV